MEREEMIKKLEKVKNDMRNKGLNNPKTFTVKYIKRSVIDPYVKDNIKILDANIVADDIDTALIYAKHDFEMSGNLIISLKENGKKVDKIQCLVIDKDKLVVDIVYLDSIQDIEKMYKKYVFMEYKWTIVEMA